MKRFEPKLADPAFRTAAEANSKVVPEWNAVVAKPKAEPAPPPPQEKETEKEKEKPKQPERTWHWPWETPRK
jgi:hypothetical protein